MSLISMQDMPAIVQSKHLTHWLLMTFFTGSVAPSSSLSWPWPLSYTQTTAKCFTATYSECFPNELVFTASMR